MHLTPDYTTLRQTTAFGYSAAACYLAFQAMGEVPLHEFFQKPEACIEAYRKGGPRIRELFGPDVHLSPPATPPISYGHPNGLGAKLFFPEGGEVGVEHLCTGSLDEAIALLKKPVDYARAGLYPFYADFRERMQAAFPGQRVGLSWGLEGPLTTAYELRGDRWFTDVLDEPEKTKEFLRLLTGSILDFHAFRCQSEGRLLISPDSAGLCDDIASMMPDGLWDEYVLPYWDLYFSGMTSGQRRAHVEDLRAAQLPYLEKAALWSYDPSISPKLNPQIVAAHCRVPFTWRLGSFHYRDMSVQDVTDFVFQATADGASSVHTVVEGSMCTAATAEKVRAFIAAAKEAKRQLDAGASRADLAAQVSPAGRRKFWDHWRD
ncbi:MAG: hypothetical protein GX595_01095 [Lentisphaerae bacterium]|nr:hypothetical protein [Lentisphaerota bacterium]